MSSIYVDEKGNMTPKAPSNGSLFTLDEIKKVLDSKDVVVINIGNFFLSFDQYGFYGLRCNQIATKWCEAAGIPYEVHGPALLIEKDAWKY